MGFFRKLLTHLSVISTFKTTNQHFVVLNAFKKPSAKTQQTTAREWSVFSYCGNKIKIFGLDNKEFI